MMRRHLLHALAPAAPAAPAPAARWPGWLAWLLKGRRLLLHELSPALVQRYHQQRQGQCRCCGACCQLAMRCLFLEDLVDGTTRCSIHAARPESCRVFPVSPVDLLELPRGTRCGYHFGPAGP